MEAATIVGKAVDIITDNSGGSNGETPLHDVDARVASPELVVNPNDGMRHSEAGLIGMTATPPSTQGEAGKEHQSPSRREGGGTGWVLVNVEGKPRPEGEMQSVDRPVTHSQDISNTLKAVDFPSTTNQPATTVSSAAKAIVMIDAKDAKPTKGKAKVKDAVSDARPFGLKRLLSFSTRGETSDGSISKSMSMSPLGGSTEEKSQGTSSRTTLRDRLRWKGPESSLKAADDNRTNTN